jgi:DNA-binding transcriptional ArsR family regulator
VSEAPTPPPADRPDASGPAGSGDVVPRLAARHVDAAALKALAHPLRFQLLELLVEHGPATASGLARKVDENSGSTSYHLRVLADRGFIVEADELGSGRDRWWRAAPGGWSLEGLRMLQEDETRDDVAVVLGELHRSRVQRLERWQRDAPRWGPAWISRSLDVTTRLPLTTSEIAQLRDDLASVIARWQAVVDDRRAAPPADTTTVTLQLDLFPSDPPPATVAEAAPDGDTDPGS